MIVLLYVAVSLLAIGLLVRWEIRRTPPSYAERLARMTKQMEVLSRTMGEVLIPVVRRANESLAAFGVALTKAFSDD